MRLPKANRLIGVLIIILLVVGCILTWYGPPHFWGDFRGIDEATAVERLGNAIYDTRKNPPTYTAELSDTYRQGDPFTLGWAYGFMRLGLHFEDGAVVSQSRRVK